MKTYVTTPDTAKIIRKALKEAFPDTKFSVRCKSYSGGSSIRVCWTDGPISSDVNEVVSRFQGSWFDGMQDLKYYRTHMFQGQEVHWGPDYVFADRTVSAAFVDGVKASYAELTAHERYKLLCETGVIWHASMKDGTSLNDPDLEDLGDDARTVFTALALRIGLGQVNPSPTAEAVTINREY